ncbi:MAG: metallophosphoesterase [Deltaproteobacteria bacterium]|nr:metallophosphoesterase [Deltaproteobacteria bacterium]
MKNIFYLVVLGLMLAACREPFPALPATPTPTPTATPTPTPTPETPENFTVAFIGDQGLGSDSQAVLQLIEDEGADMVLHQGDFSYNDDPDTWDQQINDILGDSFPYFASIGNHDEAAWSGYQQKLQTRLDKISGASCSGDLGVQAACTYQGIFFILSGVGTMGSGHEDYITTQLAQTDKIWRICSWHKNQRFMQVGDKTNEVGWTAYDNCRLGGAIIATAHEHSYSRTYLMSNIENQTVVSTSSTLTLDAGQTFVFVSGLGGNSIRAQNDSLAANPWWASVYTSTQNANFGALFCIFNYQGTENTAHCYFKDIDGSTPDTFDLISNL